MTPDELRQLIARGETLAVEFKGEERRSLSDGELVEAVVCLANRPGGEEGWLLVGVEDDGRITGARPRHGDRTDPHRVAALLASREMQALRADRGATDYSAVRIPEATWEDLDPLEFERFRRFARESLGRGDTGLAELSDVEMAKALGAVEGYHSVDAIRVLGLLLFGREDALRRLLPTHEVAYQVLVGHKVEVNEFFRWPLLRVMEELLARFSARNREEEILIGMLRVAVPDHSPAAFREAVANALVHRDYTRLGAVHV